MLILDTQTYRDCFVSSTYVVCTNQYKSWTPGSSMDRASPRRSEGCGFDSSLAKQSLGSSLRSHSNHQTHPNFSPLNLSEYMQ